MLIAATIHYNQTELILEQRQTILDAAYCAHPERFVHRTCDGGGRYERLSAVPASRRDSEVAAKAKGGHSLQEHISRYN